MFRGVISGVFWGAIVVAVVVGFASLLAPLPATVDPQVDAADSAGGPEPEGSGDIGETSEADDTVADTDAAPAPAADDSDNTPIADTSSAPQPGPVTGETVMDAPDAGEAPEPMQSGADSPVASDMTAPAPAPVAPETGDSVGSISTAPAQPQVPADTGSGAFETPAVADQDVSPAAEANEGEAMQQESLLKPAGDLDEAFPQHQSERLPTVDGEDVSEPSASTPATITTPFAANAEQFEAAGDKPLMSIVLIDDGAPAIDPQALREFPYPLSIAVPTLVTDVADRIAMYRGMGFEVLGIVDIPDVATASVVEQAMDAHIKAAEGTIGFLEGTTDGLQGSKEISDQVTAILQASGHGLLLFSEGLNTAQKLASREGVPAATVFRDLDGKDQNAATIRRFLDQAAFKATQEGGVILVGRMREQTLEALLVWGLADRAGSVALAPVSATITAKQP